MQEPRKNYCNFLSSGGMRQYGDTDIIRLQRVAERRRAQKVVVRRIAKVSGLGVLERICLFQASRYQNNFVREGCGAQFVVPRNGIYNLWIRWGSLPNCAITQSVEKAGRTVASVRALFCLKVSGVVDNLGFLNPAVLGWMKPTIVVTAKESFESSPSISSLARNNEELEPYVDAEVAAKYLSIEKRVLMDRARSGQLPGHPLPGSKRRMWRFKLGELDANMQEQSAACTIPDGSPRRRKGKL